ncbi:DUF3445 domain-containing protein [Rhodobacteraceae bacterium Araon29]
MTEILQDSLPYRLNPKRSLPAVAPLDPKNLIIIDSAYALQMAERERLIKYRTKDVTRLDPLAFGAAQELLETVLNFLPLLHGFNITKEIVKCPDGRVVSLDYSEPLSTIGNLVQCDFCILQKHKDEHVLKGAILCFPSSWSLEEQFLRPLSIIHGPIQSYDKDVTRRVQRLFDGIKPQKPLWRFNELYYDTPNLFQPRKTANRRPILKGTDRRFLRSERQVLFRLPRSNSVIFSIHTHILMVV